MGSLVGHLPHRRGIVVLDAAGSSTRRLAAAELERLDIEEPAPR